ncbi:MAG: hypothetical protein AVDCRST_MAG02-2242, partial [uncultured Rubrobacteraceae bacterium]
ARNQRTVFGRGRRGPARGRDRGRAGRRPAPARRRPLGVSDSRTGSCGTARAARRWTGRPRPRASL